MNEYTDVGKNIGRYFTKSTKYIKCFPHVCIAIGNGQEDPQLQAIKEHITDGLCEYVWTIDAGYASQNMLERYILEANIQAALYLYKKGNDTHVEIYTSEGQIKNQELVELFTGTYAWSHSPSSSAKPFDTRLSADVLHAYTSATTANLIQNKGFSNSYDHNLCVASDSAYVLDACKAVAQKLGANIETIVAPAEKAYLLAKEKQQHIFHINEHGTTLVLFTPSGNVQNQENLILATILTVAQNSNSSQVQEQHESQFPVDNVCLSIDTSKFLWDTLFTFFNTNVSVSNTCSNSLRTKAYIEKSLVWANNSCMFGFKDNDYIPDAIYAMFMLSETHHFIEETIEILPPANKATFQLLAPEFFIETILSELRAKLPHHNTFIDTNGQLICDEEWSLRYAINNVNGFESDEKQILFEIYSENPNFIVFVQNHINYLQTKYS